MQAKQKYKAKASKVVTSQKKLRSVTVSLSDTELIKT